MKTMNNRKRVSFGSKGSMVETWIIEDLPTPRSSKEEEFINSLVTHTSTKDSGLHSSSDTDSGSPYSGLSPLRDSSNRVLVLHDPFQGLSGPLDALDGRNGTVFVKDRITGWPLKRSPSLESRDNPFLPGGELSKEAEELLKKATIVRDKFFLDDQGRQQPIPDRTDNSPTKNKEQTTHDAFDGSVPNATSTHTNAGPGVVEDRISPTSAGKAEAAPVAAPHPRENGKAGDAGTSPDNVKLDVGGSPTADGAKAGGGDSAGVGGDQQDKDKAKRRPKCCVVM